MWRSRERETKSSKCGGGVVWSWWRSGTSTEELNFTLSYKREKDNKNTKTEQKTNKTSNWQKTKKNKQTKQTKTQAPWYWFAMHGTHEIPYHLKHVFNLSNLRSCKTKTHSTEFIQFNFSGERWFSWPLYAVSQSATEGNWSPGTKIAVAQGETRRPRWRGDPGWVRIISGEKLKLDEV